MFVKIMLFRKVILIWSWKNCKRWKMSIRGIKQNVSTYCVWVEDVWEICKNQKKAWTFSYFYPREAVYQISENLAHQTWRKCVTNKRTNGQTDGTEIIGPSGKIPGTNDLNFWMAVKRNTKVLQSHVFIFINPIPDGLLPFCCTWTHSSWESLCFLLNLFLLLSL